MRFTLLSTLLMGLVALTTPTHAASASSALARLSSRLAAAESSLAQLQSQSQASSETGYAPAVASYLWNNNLWTDSLDAANAAKKAKKVPDWYGNIVIISNTARGGSVLSRSASVSQAASYVSLPVSVPSGPFSVAVWLSWNAVSQPGQSEGVALSTAGDNIKLAVNNAGAVTATVGGVALAGGSVEAGTWHQYAISYSGSAASLFRNGVLVAGPTAATFAGFSSLNLLNSADQTRGFVGSVDNVQVFKAALNEDDSDAKFLFDDTRTISTGLSGVATTGPAAWWGHTGTSKIKFQNQVQAQPTGDITLSGTFLDAELRPINQLWYILYGVTGATVANVPVNYQGTVGFVSWTETTGVLVFRPTGLASAIPIGATYSFTIPASALNLNNPNVNKLATPNDARWAISISALDLDQTPGKKYVQGLRWQGIESTPFTINNNPTL